MIVTRFPKKLTTKKTTVILGSFESFHNGHLSLLEKAKSFNKPVVVMVIENPEDLPGASNKVYQPLEIRLQNLSNLGVDFTMVVKMDSKTLSMSGEAFLKKIKSTTGATRFVSGNDFAMGKGRKLKAKDIENNNVVTISKAKSGKKISTTLLKELLPLGEVALIKRLTPFAYKNVFDVKANRTISFKNSIKLHSGLYATYAVINDIRYWSYVEIPMDGTPKIHVPQLNIKNKPFKCVIEFHNIVKVIIKASQNETTQADIDKVIKVLSA